MFSENLKTLRQQRGMSQEILANKINVVRQTISKWEKGLSVPDADMLTRIADIFEVPVSELLGSRIESETDVNEIANQLAILNDQLISRKKSRTKLIKGLAIALLIIFILAIVTVLGAVGMFTVNKDYRVETSQEEVIPEEND